MFSEQSKEFVNAAIEAETASAMEKWGEKYASLHEGYAVLKEEVEEVREENIPLKNNFFDFWEGVKYGNNQKAKNCIMKVREHAEKMALECVQVAAVCNKILNGLE